jgi:hypothetical protein
MRRSDPEKYRTQAREYAKKWADKKRARLSTRSIPEYCECCGQKKKLQFDHDHVTDKFRGWICFGCNTSIGKLGDTLEGVQRAIDYLKKSVQ